MIQHCLYLFRPCQHRIVTARYRHCWNTAQESVLINTPAASSMYAGWAPLLALKTSAKPHNNPQIKLVGGTKTWLMRFCLSGFGRGVGVWGWDVVERAAVKQEKNKQDAQQLKWPLTPCQPPTGSWGVQGGLNDGIILKCCPSLFPARCPWHWEKKAIKEASSQSPALLTRPSICRREAKTTALDC